MRRQFLICCTWGLSLSPLIAVLPSHASEAGDSKWGPFRGRIIDVDTGEPIPGAVALAIWLEIVPTPVHGAQRYYDARVAVAGADGRFEIPRRPPPFFSTRISEPLVEPFAPGYAVTGLVTSADGSKVVQMRKWGVLTPEQQLRHDIGSGNHVWIPREKWLELLEIVNVERGRMGLSPIRRLSGGPE